MKEKLKYLDIGMVVSLMDKDQILEVLWRLINMFLSIDFSIKWIYRNILNGRRCGKESNRRS